MTGRWSHAALGLRAEEFERVIADGGVVLFPSDTVYGLACSPIDARAVARLYALKGREPAKASAVMFFELGAALAAVGWLGERTRAAIERLMPGAVTVLVPNPSGRFPLACGGDPSTLGLRVVSVPPLVGVRVGVLQSSANLAGGADPRRLSDVTASIREGVDLVVDGGELPGVASTVVDLRRYEGGGGAGSWSVVRSGAVDERSLSEMLDGQYHFNPETYEQMIRRDLPDYERLQQEVVAALGPGARGGSSILGAERVRRRLGCSRSTPMRLSSGSTSAARCSPSHASALTGAGELRRREPDRPAPGGSVRPRRRARCASTTCPVRRRPICSGGSPRRCGPRAGGRFVLADVVVPEDPPTR